MLEIKKSVGRPAVNAVPITVRVPPDLLGSLDAYAGGQDDKPTRPEAIRRILQDWLTRNGHLSDE